jgi:translocation and assembly module TamB
VILEGRLGLSGTLNGPWKNVVFAGAIEHRDGERRPSHLNGTARLDTRGAIVGLETDLILDSLSFDGIRRSFPTLSARGALGGRVKLSGTLDHLAIDADVSGAVGRIEALGHATLLPPRWAADSLRLRLSRLNLDALTGGAAPVSALNGVVHVTGTADSAAAPVGRLVASLGAGRIREFAFDSAAVQLHATDSLITLDTLTVGWDGGWLVGGGAIGFAPPHTGRITLHADARDLAAFDSLARGLTGFGRDPTGAESELSGRGSAGATIEGALGALRIDGTARIDSLRWLQYRVQGIQGRLQLATLDTTLDASLTIDSLSAHHLAFSQVRGLVRGHPDSLAWLAFGRGSALARLGAGGWSTRHLGERVFHADSVNLDLLRGEWRLAAPFSVRVRDSLIGLDSVRFITRDGSGSIEVAGDIPRTAPGNLSLTALGIELRDLYGLAQRDTTGLSGTLAVDARLGGTSTAPELRGTAALSGAVFGDFQAPLIRAAFDYRQRLLRSNLTFWRTGEPFVQVDASLPLELSLQTVARRQLPGALTIVATGDSIDLAIAEAFTPNLRHVSGILDVDARVEGSWDAPRLAGTIRLTGGAAEVPSLGVRYGPVAGRLRLTGDSLIAEGMTVASRTGSLNITGGIRLERLTQPLLGLDLSARDFELINVPNYLKLQSWGDVSLRGPLLHPVLTGSGRLSNSVIYFADLVSKDIVNLEDPMNADLVDTLALRVQDLGANFQSRFLDSLSIRNLDFIAGEGVWLRSNEANFQLEGRVRVNKTRRLYRMDGSFDTPRGTYNFNIGGLINRTFTVERGTVHYFGDLNAELDVSARHVVKTPQGSGSDVPVIAHITGTLQVPKLSLATPPDRPGLTEPQLISLLMLGTTNPAAAGQLGTASQTRSAFGAVALTGLSSELQRALISDLGAPLDIVEIRPGLATSGFVGGTASTTQLAVGRAITSKLFVTANAGFCFSAGQSAFNARNLGASLEYRFRRELRFLLSAEPLQTCFATGADAFTSAKRYQFGAELRWDRDY